MALDYNYNVIFRHLFSGSSRTAGRCRPEKTFLLVAAFVVSLMVIGGAADVQHAGDLGQAVASDPTPYHLTGSAWSILDMATSALLPGYAFAQVQDSTPPTFDSSELHSDTGVLTITFSETIDVTPATNVVPAKIHIRESDSYTGGITLSAGELDTAAAADGATISFTLTESHIATVAGLTMPELTIEPGAVRDTSGNPIDGTFDISTAVFVDATLIRSWGHSPTGMTFSNDGLRMFVIDGSGYDIDEYTLSAAFDASTRIFVNSTSVSTNYHTPTDMAFSNDGLKMFIVNYKERTIEEYTLSTAFDVSTLEFVRDQLVRIQERNPTGMAFSSDGLKMFVVGFEKDNVNEYTLSAPFDLYGRVFVHAISVADQVGTPRDVAFSNDGLKMFVVDSNQVKVHEYTLSTAFDVSTAIHVDFLSVAGRESTPKGMAFSNDGAKMFVVGSGSDNVNEYTLNSVYPITVTTASATTPTLASIVRYDPVAANTGSQTLVYKATFSENVTGVDASDFALSSGSTGGTGGGSSPVTNISGLGDVYHVTVFALQNGTYNLDLVSSGHGIADAAANPLTNTTPTTGTDHTYTVSIIPPDNTVPTLASIHRSSPAVGNTDSQTLVYKVTFSEDVTGVNTSDFALSPDSIGGAGSTNIGGNSEQFTQTRSPALAIPDMITVYDTITILNSGTAASVYVAVDITHAYIGDLRIDLIAPDGATRTLHNREGGSAGDIDRMYTLSFDDLVVAGTWTLRIHDGFNVYQGVLNNWTLTVNYGDPPTIPVTGISGSGDVYYVTVSALQGGAYNLDLVSSGHDIADAASNPLANTSPTGADETYTVSTTVIDNTNPRLASIERYNPTSATTDSQSLIYKATFDESVTGVDTSDFVLSSVGGNAGTGSITGISGSGSVYYVTVSAAQDGTYNLDLVSSGHGIRDAANNLLNNTTPTTGTDETYTVSITVTDNTNPRLASIERYNPTSATTDSQSLIYKATFDESVTGVDTSDFVLSSVGGNAGTGSITGISGSGSVYYVTVSAAQDGTYNLDLVSSGHGIRDAANNLLNNTTPTTGTDETYTVSITVTDNTNPRLASIERYNPTSATTDSQSLIYKATFDESVTGVDASDFVLSSVGGNAGTGSITGISGSGSVYYVTVSAAQDGTYNLDLVSSGHGIRDAANNLLNNTTPTTGTDETYTVSITVTDNTNPRLASIERYNPASQNTDSQSLIYKATFDESVTGVDTSDFVLSSVGGNAGTGSITGISGSGSVYYVTVSAAQDGTYNLDLVSSGHGIRDAANNLLNNTTPTTGTDETYTVSITVTDNTNPRLASIERYNPTSATTDSQSLIYKATFDESVTGVDTSDFVLSSVGGNAGTGSITGISGSGSVYYVTVSAAQDGTYNLDLVSSGHGIRDAANNLLNNTTPTTGTDETYTVSITVTDNTNPRLASIERYNPTSATTDSQSLIYKATFDESVTGVDASDFVLSSVGGNAGTGSITGISGSGSVYYVTVSAAQDGTYNLDLVSSGHGIRDAANNLLNNTTPTTGTDETYTVSITVTDNTNPRLASIERYNPASQNTDSQSLIYKATFDESVTGVDTSDFVLSSVGGNAGTGSITGISGSGSVYYVTVSAAQDGTYNLDLVSSGHGIRDAANNLLNNTTPTTGTDETYTVSITVTDNTNPRLASIERYNPASQNTDSQSLIYKATFDESVTGVDTSDFVLSSVGGNAGTGSITGISGSGSVYYVTVSAAQDGTYNLDLVSSGHGIRDAANNLLNNTTPTTGTDETYTVSITVTDNTNPRLASIERYNPASQNTDSQSLIYKATFDESVTGVDTSDFVLSSVGGNAGTGSITGISGSGSVYYVTISASQDGTYNLDLVSSGHGIEDIAENPLTNIVSTSGTDHTYTVSIIPADVTAPTLASIERYNPAAENTDSQTLVYKVTFSESVTGVDTSDFTLSPGSTGNGTGSGQFTQTRTPAITIPYDQIVTDTILVTGSGTATSVSVAVDIAHQYVVDLKVDLIAPDGTVQTLHDRPSGPANIDQTYTPDFGSVSIAGNWTLQMHDDYSADDGILNSWMLTVNHDSDIATHVTSISGSGDVYYATLSAAQDGTYNLDLVSSGHNITDAAANSLTGTIPTSGTDHTYTVNTIPADVTAPTLASIERYSPAAENTDSQTLVYKVTFSENVTGVDTDDFVLSSGSTGNTTTTANSVTSISGSGSVYYATVSVSTDGTYNLDLVSSGHNITDAAANPLTGTIPTTGTDHTYTVNTVPADATAPTLASIERYNPAAENTDSQTLVYKVTFSENVTGVDTTDFTLSPGSTGTGSGQFTQTRTPAITIPYDQIVTDTILVTGSGTATSVSVAVDIAHQYVVDLKVDLIAPDGTVQTLHDHPSGPANIDQTYTPDFGSVSIAGNWTLQMHDDYSADDGILNSWMLTVNHDSDIATHVTSISGSGDVYYATLSAAQDGTYNLDLVSSGHNITDAAANSLTGTIPTSGTDHTYTVNTIPADVTAPTLASIERYSPAAENTDSQTLVYKVTFSENVTGVDTDDFVLSSGSTGNTTTTANSVTSISGSGSVYYATVSVSTDGTYNLDLVSSGHNITDAAANPLTGTIPTTGTDHTYTVNTVPADATAPTLASIERYNPAAENTDSQTLVYKVTFSENVTGVDTSDFTLSPGSTGTGSGQFTQTRTPAITITYDQIVTDTILVTGSGTATSVSVAVDIAHQYVVDLKVDLIAPDGTVQTLHDRPSGPANINQTYAPDFGSASIAGNWTLQMHDDYSADDGILNSWTLTVNHDPDTTAHVTSISGSGDVYYATLFAVQDGTYNLDLVSSGHNITDAAANPLTGTIPTTGTDHTYTVNTIPADATAPTLASIERYNPAAENTDSQTLVYKVTFSENVTGVDTTDFTLSPDSTGGSANNTSGQFTQTQSPSLAIPDMTTVSDTIAVPDSGTATSVSVSVDITHAWIGDLLVELIAPDGTTRTLHNREGGSADDIDQTYTPDFGGVSIAGTWTLRIYDGVNADPGVLNNWTLTVNPDSDTATHATSISGSGDVYYVTVSAAQEGTYNLDLVSSDHGITGAASNLLTDTIPTETDHTYTVSTAI